MGGLVFGKKTPINYQINLYLLSRITIALAEKVHNKYLEQNEEITTEQISTIKKHSFRILAALVWGLVMWLFFINQKVLQPSLASSMNHLYISS